MALSAFDQRSRPPAEDEVASVLGPAHPLWCDLRERLAAVLEPCSEVWGFTGKSTGWGLRVKRGDRVVVYLTPRVDGFMASLVLGDRAVQAARGGDLPENVIALVDSARRYAEGTGVRFDVGGPRDVDAVVALATIKIAY